MATALVQAKSLTWGTYGPGAVEAHETHGTPLPSLTFKTLGELDTDHLEAILVHLDEKNRLLKETLSVAITLIMEDRRKV